MQPLIDLYDQFLKFFPDPWHPWISLSIFIVMVFLVLKHWKTGVIGIILLVIFVPASVPILRNIGIGLIEFATHVLGK